MTETTLSIDCAYKSMALLFPADGTEVRLVSYDIKQSDDGDGTVDFGDYLPDLRPWLGDAFPERDFANFYVDSKEQRNPDCGGSLIQSNDQSVHGRYCLYYTTSSLLPLNETCKRLIEANPPAGRLFWRGDILLVRYIGELGMGHEYVDAPLAMSAPVANILKSAYAHQRLEKKADSDKKFELEMERWKLRNPESHRAVDTGALERYRTGQTMSEEDKSLVASVLGKRPDGSGTSPWSRTSQMESEGKW